MSVADVNSAGILVRAQCESEAGDLSSFNGLI
jgi:hypothetical protein